MDLELDRFDHLGPLVRSVVLVHSHLKNCEYKFFETLTWTSFDPCDSSICPGSRKRLPAAYAAAQKEGAGPRGGAKPARTLSL